jgi:hypothetical protein
MGRAGKRADPSVKLDLSEVRGRIGAVAVFALLASCRAVPPQPAPPPPPPPPAPTSTPTPAPTPLSTASWEEAPVEQGDWRHERSGDTSAARFVLADGLMPRNAVTLTCDRTRQQIVLSVRGTAGNAAVAIRTTFGTMAWNGIARSMAGESWIDMARPASDQGFDWMGFSRGRIAIEAPGQARLVIPAWAEIGRVVEDCRN